MAAPVQDDHQNMVPMDHGAWSLAEWLALPPTHSHVELVDGMLVMSPNEAVPNKRLMARIWRQLEDAAPPQFEALPDSNVALGGDRALIPDFVVIDRPGFDGLFLPARNVVLVGEVASPSTRVYDRTTKRALYAESGIPFLMLVDPGEPPTALLFELQDGEYVEIAGSTDGRLEMERPFRVALDLTAPAPPPAA